MRVPIKLAHSWKDCRTMEVVAATGFGVRLAEGVGPTEGPGMTGPGEGPALAPAAPDAFSSREGEGVVGPSCRNTVPAAARLVIAATRSS
jgi:hypothetical protein